MWNGLKAPQNYANNNEFPIPNQHNYLKVMITTSDSSC